MSVFWQSLSELIAEIRLKKHHQLKRVSSGKMLEVINQHWGGDWLFRQPLSNGVFSSQWD
ncbi:hypothetical protein [Endozoicomonas sp. YOMI1]|uniref:hypothetical protein n=1 Tax=Endozoicomonas sp. YOMI1 TaxID=2828739 RepID=UPI002147455E|nr:hypothetical protein [Endozoicomonas sp. YOMI1]